MIGYTYVSVFLLSLIKAWLMGRINTSIPIL